MTEYQENKTYMSEMLSDVTEESLKLWLSEENLAEKHHREFAGFEITDAIDGGKETNREVSLVKIKAVGQYPQHIHKNSDAYFIITSGRATLLSGSERRTISEGDKIEIPRGMAHGFELEENSELEFISIQSPPIKNIETGEEDLHLTDFV